MTFPFFRRCAHLKIESPDPHKRMDFTLLQACYLGNVEDVRLALSRGYDVNEKNERGWYPLALACRKGDLAMVECLLANGAIVHREHDQGQPPMFLACGSGRMDIVECLMDAGADVNAKDSNGSRAIHCAAVGGRIEIVDYMRARGVDINSRTNENFTPLHAVCLFGLREDTSRLVSMIRHLINVGAIVDVDNRSGNTPFHSACLRGNVEIAKVLLDTGLIDIDARNMRGRTPLHLACGASGDLNMVKFLVENGADRHIRVECGTALDIARIYKKRPQIVAYLENALELEKAPPVAQIVKRGDLAVCVHIMDFLATPLRS